MWSGGCGSTGVAPWAGTVGHSRVSSRCSARTTQQCDREPCRPCGASGRLSAQPTRCLRPLPGRGR
eukprot:1040091-Lingulodinium_polyedra.AAC.1